MTALTPKRLCSVCVGLTALILAAAAVALVCGAADVGLGSLWKLIAGGANQVEKTIILKLRLPRILLAALAGMALAQCGTVFQAVLRNPLAEPFILGISSGAALGAVSAIVLGTGSRVVISGAAFGGALFTVALIMAFARRRERINTTTLLLCGVVLNAFFVAIIMFFIATTTDQKLHSILFWLYGDLSSSQYSQVWALLPIALIGAAILYRYARHLNLFTAGEETASQLGMNVESAKNALLIIVSLMVGFVVSVSGIIGFVGLIVPHLMRMAFGADHRLLLPASALFGAFFLIAADTLSRVLIAPNELPVGVITAFLGAPFFIVLLNRRGSGWNLS